MEVKNDHFGDESHLPTGPVFHVHDYRRKSNYLRVNLRYLYEWNEQFLISYQGSGMKLTSNLRFLIILDRSIYLRYGPAASFGKRWMTTRCHGCRHPSSLEKEPISLATAMVITNIETMSIPSLHCTEKIDITCVLAEFQARLL